MLNTKFVRENIDKLEDIFKNRNVEIDISAYKSLDIERRTLVQEVEALKQERNELSIKVGQMKSKGGDVSEILEGTSVVSNKIKQLDAILSELDEKTHFFASIMPNICDEDVPIGRTEDENVEVKKWGEPRKFDFKVKSHEDILESLDMLDSKRASKMSGSRFIAMKGKGARLERSLINFMLDEHEKKDYIEISPPILVNEDAMFNSGQLPKFRDDAFITTNHTFLIPTGEVPLVNLHAKEIFNEKDLPIKYTAFTPCFRKEAGSYGKDTKGLIRLHQFGKVELVQIVKPEDSEQSLQTMLGDAESILQKLNLPYRVVLKCTGDTGFTAVKTYDIEVWMPSQGKYREISSCSNTKDFQSRRAGIKFKRDNKTEFVHFLNGSGLAVGRTIAALVENYQKSDGTFTIPDILLKS